MKRDHSIDKEFWSLNKIMRLLHQVWVGYDGTSPIPSLNYVLRFRKICNSKSKNCARHLQELQNVNQQTYLNYFLVHYYILIKCYVEPQVWFRRRFLWHLNAIWREVQYAHLPLNRRTKITNYFLFFTSLQISKTGAIIPLFQSNFKSAINFLNRPCFLLIGRYTSCLV